MKEQSIVGLGISNKPLHSLDDVLLCRAHNGVLLVVGQENHVFPLVAIALDEEVGKVLDIVDTSAQFAFFANVVDSDQQSLAFTRAVGVLEGIAIGCAVAELLRSGGNGVGLVGLLAAVAAGVAATAANWVAVGV